MYGTLNGKGRSGWLGDNAGGSATYNNFRTLSAIACGTPWCKHIPPTTIEIKKTCVSLISITRAVLQAVVLPAAESKHVTQTRGHCGHKKTNKFLAGLFSLDLYITLGLRQFTGRN